MISYKFEGISLLEGIAVAEMQLEQFAGGRLPSADLE